MSYIYHHYGADVPFDWKRWLLEGLMCGFIGLTFSYGPASRCGQFRRLRGGLYRCAGQHRTAEKTGAETRGD